MNTFKEIWDAHQKEKVAPVAEAPVEEAVEAPELSQSAPSESHELRLSAILPLFGIDSLMQVGTKERDMLDFISATLKGDLGMGIMKLENELGKPPLGVSRIRHIYNALRFGYGTESGDSQSKQSDNSGDTAKGVDRDVSITIRLGDGEGNKAGG